MAELKNCPFCGKEAVFKVTSKCSSASDIGIGFTVGCPQCKVFLSQNFQIRFRLYYDGSISTPVDERDDAAEAWNRRPLT